MKNLKSKRAALALILALVFTLEAGCGSGASKYNSTAFDGYASDSYYEAAEEAAAYDWDESAISGASNSTVEAKVEEDDVEVSDQKMIITWDISISTEKYDDTMAALRKSVAEAGGYLENEYEGTYGASNRYANFTIRIPVKNAENWVNQANTYGTITSKSKSQRNVTLEYVDMESRIKALRTEQESLLAILEKAETVEDIITVQSELTNVNYQIESYESQLRSLANQVNYSTISVNIDEVSREVPVEKTFGQEIQERFLDSLDDVIEFGRNLVIFLLGDSLKIIIWIIVIVIAVKIFKKLNKNGKAKREERKAAKVAQKEAKAAQKEAQKAQENVQKTEAEADQNKDA